ncbi:MAG TPA: cysteine desulfurase family protein [Planctomycetota bacterium]|nr:cysteine desulfurase family protein [Planctomycetota bacterium]
MPIYFDYNATAPLAPAAEAAWLEIVHGAWGNASSVHARGQAALHHLDAARRSIAQNLGCEPDQLVFNSGATEGSNHVVQALLSIPRAAGRSDSAKPHAIVSAIEHHCVLEPAQTLHKQGVAEIDFIDASTDGRVDVAKIAAKFHPNTVLVALMAVNNETGVIQDIPALAKHLAEYNRTNAPAGAQPGLFCDATQALGKLSPAHVAGADWVCFSGHKFGAPKGIGGLICRRDLPPLFYGGNAEHARRPGTVPVEAVHAMAAALAAAETDRPAQTAKTARLRDQLEAGICAAIPTAVVAGQAAPRVANTSFVCFRGLRAETLVMNFDLAGLCTSTGAACVQGAAQTSHVLAAMHLPADQIVGAVRFSLGPNSTTDEVVQAIAIVREVCQRLKR